MNSNSSTVIIRQDGTKCLGSDESSGWIWQAGRVLASQLLSSSSIGLRQLRILELGSGTRWLALTLAHAGGIVTATERPGALALLTRNVYGHLDRVANTISDEDSKLDNGKMASVYPVNLISSLDQTFCTLLRAVHRF